MEIPDVPTFEQRIRTMLHERAGDVTPDPATWRAVERRARRHVAGLRLAVAGVAAALAACALVVVPALTRGPEIRFPDGPAAPPAAPDQATPAPAPGNVLPAPGQATPAPARPATPAPGGPLVVTDGSSVLLTDGRGRVEEVLWRGDDTVHCTDGACADRPYVTHLDVRPGSRADDLVVVYGWSGCGSLSWGSATLVDGELVRGGGGVPTGAVCAADAAFSPDGDALAVLDGEGGGPWRLHVQRWTDEGPSDVVPEDEGPGTGDPAGIAELGLDGWTDLRVADWRWTSSAADGARRGEVLLVGSGADRREAVRVAVEQTADGAYRVEDGTEAVGTTGGGWVLGAAGEHRLVARDAHPEGSASVGTAADPRVVSPGLPDLALPEAVLTADREPWLATGGNGTVVVGDGASRAWTAAAGDEGWSALVELPGPVTAVDAITPAAAGPAPAPRADG